MADKSYRQMGADFRKFYFKEIKPCLPQYEKQRILGVIQSSLFTLAWISFFLGITLLISEKNFPSIGFIGFKFIIFAIVCIIILSFLPEQSARSENGTRVIKTNFEHDLKALLMKKFLAIFSENATWHQGFCFSDCDKAVLLRKYNIFNPFPFVIFDDAINLEYNGVKIKINEISTEFFNYSTLFLFTFLFCMFYMIFNVLFLIVLALVIILSFEKILRYSPFRGLVVELEMNKKFNGHTFFLDSSFNSKTIKINRKKFESVVLESVGFMKKYNVFSTDQIEARYILTTALIDELEHLKFAFRAKYIRGCFIDNKFILAIHTGKDMFAMGSDFKKSSLKTFQDLFDEIVSILKITNQLSLD